MKPKQKVDFQKIKQELFYINKLRKYKRDCRADTISREKEFSLSTYAKLVNRDSYTFVEYQIVTKYGLYPSIEDEEKDSEYNSISTTSEPSKKSRNHSSLNLKKLEPSQVTEYSDIMSTFKRNASIRAMTPMQLARSKSQKNFKAPLTSQSQSFPFTATSSVSQPYTEQNCSQPQIQIAQQDSLSSGTDSSKSVSQSLSEFKRPVLTLRQNQERRKTILLQNLEKIKPEIFLMQNDEIKEPKILQDYLTTYSYIANQSLLKGCDPFIQSKRNSCLKSQISVQQRIKNSIHRLFQVYQKEVPQNKKRNLSHKVV